jgi:putative endonuclease
MGLAMSGTCSIRPAAAEAASPRGRLGLTNAAAGLQAEESACRALVADGWNILGRRMRTKSGEIDAVAEKDGLLAFVEVKARPTLAMAAEAIRPRQQVRLLAAAEILLAENPGWGSDGVRFDVILVDTNQRVRRVKDAIRLN